jgi:hypothetical protein
MDATTGIVCKKTNRPADNQNDDNEIEKIYQEARYW